MPDRRPGGDSPADVVAEASTGSSGESITRLRRDLNNRGIRTRTGHQWYNQTLRNMLLNPAYAGLRVYRRGDHATLTGAILPGVRGDWPPLVEEAKFWRVFPLLTDASRTTNIRPHHGEHLLSGIATCAQCGSNLIRRAARNGQGREQYICATTCASAWTSPPWMSSWPSASWPGWRTRT